MVHCCVNRCGAFLVKTGMLRQLTTGHILIDTVVAAIIPIVMHHVSPRSRITGKLWLDCIVLASIPLIQENASR